MRLKTKIPLTYECCHPACQVDHSTPGKVPDSAVGEPPIPRPEPVRRDRVNDGGHDGAEDDVAVEVAALGYRSGDDGGAGGGESALTPGEEHDL